MPRKIDYELKSRSKVIKKDLNKQNAIVDAVRHGKIVKAEILSNTELVAKDPIHQALITKQAEESIKSNLKAKEELREVNDNILTELRTIANKRDVNNLEILEDIRDLLKTPKTEGAIPLPGLETDEGAVGGKPVEIDIDKGLNERLITMYDKPSELIINGNVDEIKQKVDELKKDISKTNLGHYNVFHVKDLSLYRNRLKDILRALEVQKGKGIMTNLVDLKERLQLLVGSIEAGNGSKELKNELADILHYLYKKKMINLNAYKMFMNLTH